MIRVAHRLARTSGSAAWVASAERGSHRVEQVVAPERFREEWDDAAPGAPRRGNGFTRKRLETTTLCSERRSDASLSTMKICGSELPAMRVLIPLSYQRKGPVKARLPYCLRIRTQGADYCHFDDVEGILILVLEYG
jgi:hypothetical protein